MRIGPSHPWLGAAGFHLALPLLEFYYRKLAIHRSESRFTRERVLAIKDKIERGQTVYLAGVYPLTESQLFSSTRPSVRGSV
jgi:carbamoyltransferase